MKLTRILLAVAFSSAILTSLHAGEKAKNKSGTIEGTFVGIEQGDYAHFQIKDKHGAPASFIILRPDASVDSYLHNPAKLKGRKIRVYWTEEMIPEAGGKEKTITKVEARAPLDH